MKVTYSLSTADEFDTSVYEVVVDDKQTRIYGWYYNRVENSPNPKLAVKAGNTFSKAAQQQATWEFFFKLCQKNIDRQQTYYSTTPV